MNIHADQLGTELSADGFTRRGRGIRLPKDTDGAAPFWICDMEGLSGGGGMVLHHFGFVDMGRPLVEEANAQRDGW